MPFVSITRLRVNSIFRLPAFMRANEASVKQLVSTPGFIAGKELIDEGLTFWTLTIWSDDTTQASYAKASLLVQRSFLLSLVAE